MSERDGTRAEADAQLIKATIQLEPPSFPLQEVTAQLGYHLNRSLADSFVAQGGRVDQLVLELFGQNLSRCLNENTRQLPQEPLAHKAEITRATKSCLAESVDAKLTASGLKGLVAVDSLVLSHLRFDEIYNESVFASRDK